MNGTEVRLCRLGTGFLLLGPLGLTAALELVYAPAGLGEALPLLDERLVHDAAEVVAVAAITRTLHRVDDVADAHRLAASEGGLDRLDEAHLVAGPRPPAAAPATQAAQSARELRDLTV